MNRLFLMNHLFRLNQMNQMYLKNQMYQMNQMNQMYQMNLKYRLNLKNLQHHHHLKYLKNQMYQKNLMNHLTKLTIVLQIVEMLQDLTQKHKYRMLNHHRYLKNQMNLKYQSYLKNQMYQKNLMNLMYLMIRLKVGRCFPIDQQRSCKLNNRHFERYLVKSLGFVLILVQTFNTFVFFYALYYISLELFILEKNRLDFQSLHVPNSVIVTSNIKAIIN